MVKYENDSKSKWARTKRTIQTRPLEIGSAEVKDENAMKNWLWAALFFWPFQMGHHIIIIIVRQHYDHDYPEKKKTQHKTRRAHGKRHPNRELSRVIKATLERSQYLNRRTFLNKFLHQDFITKQKPKMKRKKKIVLNGFGPRGVMIALFH